MMISLRGTYYNGEIKISTKIKTTKPLKVIVTFLENISIVIDKKEKKKSRGLQINDFSFLKAQELLKNYKGSFSDEVIKERRDS